MKIRLNSPVIGALLSFCACFTSSHALDSTSAAGGKRISTTDGIAVTITAAGVNVGVTTGDQQNGGDGTTDSADNHYAGGVDAAHTRSPAIVLRNLRQGIGNMFAFGHVSHSENQRGYYSRTLSSASSASGCTYEPSQCICLGALERSGFNLYETSKFERWFNDDSSFQLAEAGSYHGLEGIRVISKLEHFKNGAFEYVPIPQSILYDPATKYCTSTFVIPTCTSFSPLTLGGSMGLNAGVKLEYKIINYPSPQDTRAQILIENVYYFLPQPYIVALEGVMKSDKLANTVCNIMKSDCPHTFARNFPVKEEHIRTPDPSSSCADKMFGLRHNMTEVFDGNSFGCRVLHANLARENPDHCPHISFLPEEDKHGYIKCQESAGIRPSDLFNELELDMFGKFESKYMIYQGLSFKDQFFENDICYELFRQNQDRGLGSTGLVMIIIGVFIGLVMWGCVGFRLLYTRFDPPDEVKIIIINSSSTDSSSKKNTHDDGLSVLATNQESHTDLYERKEKVSDVSLPIPKDSNRSIDYTEDIGHMVNRLIDMRNADSNDMNGQKQRLTTSVLAIAFAFMGMLCFLVPLSIFVIEPAFEEQSTPMNMVLLDDFDRNIKETSMLSFTDSAPTSIMDKRNFSLFVCLSIWVWAVSCGLGLEVFVTVTALKDGWKESHEYWWRLVQHIFPIGALTGFGLAASKNYLVLVFLYISNYKCGFPESLLTMHSALFDTSLSKDKRVCHFFDAAGLIWHHSATALGACYLVTGVGRPDQSVLDPLMIMIAQHGVSYLRYWHNTAYIIIELILEIFLQWSLFSNLENYAHNHWTVTLTAFGLMYAHWIWLCTGTFKVAKVNVSRFRTARGKVLYDNLVSNNIHLNHDKHSLSLLNV